MIRATIIKDVQLLLRDRGALASMFALPLAFITVFGFMFRGAGDDSDNKPRATPRVKLALYAPGTSDASTKLKADLMAASALTVSVVDSVDEVHRRVASKEDAAGLVVPEKYSGGQEAPIELIIDDAAPDAERGPIEGAVIAVTLRSYYLTKYGSFLSLAGGDDANADAVSSKMLVKKAPEGTKKKRDRIDSFQITIPGNAVLFIFFLIVPIALSFVEERKTGTWKRLLAAPVDRRLVLVAKLVPFFVIGLLQMLFLFAFGVLVFGMDISGSIPALILICMATVFAATCLGYLFASFGGSEKQISALASIFTLVMGLCSGCMFPRAFMPEGFKIVGLAIPHGWALDAFQDVLVRSGTTLADVALPAAIISAMGLLYALIASFLFRFER